MEWNFTVPIVKNTVGNRDWKTIYYYAILPALLNIDLDFRQNEVQCESGVMATSKTFNISKKNSSISPWHFFYIKKKRGIVREVGINCIYWTDLSKAVPISCLYELNNHSHDSRLYATRTDPDFYPTKDCQLVFYCDNNKNNELNNFALFLLNILVFEKYVIKEMPK